MPVLEELHRPFVFLGLFARGEGAEVAAFARLRIDLPRVESILPRFEFANHGVTCDSSYHKKCRLTQRRKERKSNGFLAPLHDVFLHATSMPHRRRGRTRATTTKSSSRPSNSTSR